jgi:hypothetical protein
MEKVVMSWWELRVTDASREVQLLQEGREVKYTIV